MTSPVIGFAGLTHLGINSLAAAAARGFDTIGFHPDKDLVNLLGHGKFPIHEPGLSALFEEHQQRLNFSSNPEALRKCDLVYISVDVPTDDYGQSDLGVVEKTIHTVTSLLKDDAILVILCQVPPGFTRKLKFPHERLFFQVETLIFGRAVERAMYPERFIVGCEDPDKALPSHLKTLLLAFECPVLAMRYESAELTKISINMCLVASVSTANTLAEICENIGADWSEIIPALGLDKRIGQYSYLKPGLGIAGGNLERDLTTILNFSKKHRTDGGVVSAWVYNSKHRKDWAWKTLNELVLKKQKQPIIAILGLTYKENTHSLKNSPSIALITKIQGHTIKAYDPSAEENAANQSIARVTSVVSALEKADVLLVMTPWPEFASIKSEDIEKSMKGRIVIDPYRILAGKELVERGFIYATLGEPVRQPKRRN